MPYAACPAGTTDGWIGPFRGVRVPAPVLVLIIIEKQTISLAHSVILGLISHSILRIIYLRYQLIRDGVAPLGGKPFLIQLHHYVVV